MRAAKPAAYERTPLYEPNIQTLNVGIVSLCLFLLVFSAWTPSIAASSSFIRTDYPSGNAYPIVVTVCDFNGDAKSDLAGAHKYGTIGVLLNHGNGTFDTAVHYADWVRTLNSVTAADFNGDNKMDSQHRFPLIQATAARAASRC